MTQRISWIPHKELKFNACLSRDYLVKANWALYCDNYLEGFHIPYIHPSLNEVLNYSNYKTILFPLSNLQIGIAQGAEDTFDLPKNSPEYGKNVAAYYFWLWANMMFNYYPWGLSINIVNPLDFDRTKISFLTYVWKPELLHKGAGSGLDRVEREDESVIEMVQAGLNSRFYTKGRFSPTMEKGVHHFHRLLCKFFSEN